MNLPAEASQWFSLYASFPRLWGPRPHDRQGRHISTLDKGILALDV